MLALKPRFRRKRSFPVTVNGRAVYCAIVRRWTSRQARQIVYLNAAYRPAFVKEKRRFTCLKILQKAHRQVTLITVVTGHPRPETNPEEAEVMHHHAQNRVMARARGGRGFESQLQAQEKTFCFRGKYFQMTSFGSACPILHRSAWWHPLPLCESCS